MDRIKLNAKYTLKLFNKFPIFKDGDTHNLLFGSRFLAPCDEIYFHYKGDSFLWDPGGTRSE